MSMLADAEYEAKSYNALNRSAIVNTTILQ